MSERIYKGDYGFDIEFVVSGGIPSGTVSVHYIKPDGSTGSIAPTSVVGSSVLLTVPAGLLDQVGVYRFYLVASDSSHEITSTVAAFRVFERGE